MIRVLIVEDEEELRITIAQILVHFRFDVIQASDGREAFDRLKNPNHGIRIVLSDIQMPHVSGDQLITKARAAKVDVPFVFMTGYCTPAQRTTIEAHRAPVLRKPCSGRHIASTLRRLASVA